MFGYDPNKKTYGFNAADVSTQQAPDPNYSSVVQQNNKVDIAPAEFQGAPRTNLYQEQQPVRMTQAANQSYAPVVKNESTRFKGLTVDDEAKLMEQAGGNIYKAQDIYPKLLQNKQDSLFLKDREQIRNDLYVQASQSKDSYEAGRLTQVARASQFADYIRKIAMQEGHLGVSQIDDNTLISHNVNQNKEKGVELLNEYMSGKYDVQTFMDKLQGKYVEPTQQPKESNTLANIAGGILDTASSTAQIGQKVGDRAGYNLIKLIYGQAEADRVKAQFGDSLMTSSEQFNQNNGVDTSSAAYQIPKAIGDIAQTAAGGEIVKGIGVVANAGKAIEGAGKLGQYANMAIEGAGQAAGYSAIADKQLPNTTDIGVGAGLNVVLGAGGKLLSKGLKAAGNKLQLSGLINPQKLEYVQNALKEGGDQVDNVTEWMNQRNLVGSKKTIISKLQEEGKKTYTAVREAVKQADNVVPPIQDSSVKGALEELINVTNGVKSPQKKTVYDNLVGLLQKHDNVGLSPSEIQGVKDSLDELMNIYTLAGDVKAGVQKADLANLRSNIRGLLENTVGKATGADIAMLNRDTAVAYKLAEGIAKKSNSENIRELLSPFAPSAIGGVYGGSQGNTPEERIMNAIKYGIAGYVAGNTTFKTVVGKGLKTASKLNIPTGSLSAVIGEKIGNQVRQKPKK